MRRYMIFTYPDYYPSGAMGDLFCSIDDKDEALEFAARLKAGAVRKDKYYSTENVEVHDRDAEDDVTEIWYNGIIATYKP